MKENKLADLSMDFSVQIINLVKDLKAKHASVISNQIGRSGTSIGANINEAVYGSSKADFSAERHISLKEAGEGIYWLTLLKRTAVYGSSKADFIAERHISLKEAGERIYWLTLLKRTAVFEYNYNLLLSRAEEIKRIPIASINTAKENHRG